APDPDVMLFKQGLDLRLKARKAEEFEEDCKRIQQPMPEREPMGHVYMRTEQRLQEKIDSAAADYEQ
ncbi:unnamed protein product, partial [Effrenium voratum]